MLDFEEEEFAFAEHRLSAFVDEHGPIDGGAVEFHGEAVGHVGGYVDEAASV